MQVLLLLLNTLLLRFIAILKQRKTQKNCKVSQSPCFVKSTRRGAIRQIRISGNQLSDSSVKQLSLFESVEENQSNEKQKSLQKVIDEIREKFDFLSIQKASSLSEGSRVIYRNKLIGGHAASQNKEDKDVS